MQFTHMHYNLRNIFLVIELSLYGIVFLTLLLMQNLLTYLKIAWIYCGLIKKLNYDWHADIAGNGSRSANS